MVLFSAKFGFHGVEKCIWDILNVAESSDRDKLCGSKVGGTEKCGVVERYRFRKPGPCAVKNALEQYTPKISFSEEVSLMKNCVFTELNPMEISDIVKSCPPKTGTPMENHTVKIGTSLKDDFTEGTGAV